MVLADLKPGDQATIKRFAEGIKSHPAYRQKLLAMGLTPNTSIQMIRKAPLGDPIEIQVRNYYLSLRSREAIYIIVEKT
ncbi:MAG: iron transporter FeoA [Gammaproteobacteria bacterium RIFCSPHIGHO2_12_FULL_41_15]|nr:MAG: iron transporter FeoA [Gammaproteobacteria bacterium RIFCSPHIGHO2_12_FULL_41_15]